MGFIYWLSSDWFSLVQSVGIIGGLVFAGLQFRSDRESHRISNLLTIVEHHAELWTKVLEDPELIRILKPSPRRDELMPTSREEVFLNLLIVHLSISWKPMLKQKFVTAEALKRDIKDFFGLPIPRRYWETNKSRYDHELVAFVDKCISES